MAARHLLTLVKNDALHRPDLLDAVQTDWAVIRAWINAIFAHRLLPHRLSGQDDPRTPAARLVRQAALLINQKLTLFTADAVDFLMGFYALLQLDLAVQASYSVSQRHCRRLLTTRGALVYLC